MQLYLVKSHLKSIYIFIWLKKTGKKYKNIIILGSPEVGITGDFYSPFNIFMDFTHLINSNRNHFLNQSCIIDKKKQIVTFIESHMVFGSHFNFVSK